MSIEILDRPPLGWFLLEVRRKTKRQWDWVALVGNIDPESEAFREWQEKGRGLCHLEWVRIPGKHRTLEAAWEAFGDLTATRH
jgi:hypothetical protein